MFGSVAIVVGLLLPVEPAPRTFAKVEVCGTLLVHKDRISVMIPAGGGCMVAYDDQWELYFTDEEQRKAAAKLKDQLIVVTGHLAQQRPVPLASLTPNKIEYRTLIAVKTLKEAPKK